MNRYEQRVFLEAFEDELEKIALDPKTKAKAAILARGRAAFLGRRASSIQPGPLSRPVGGRSTYGPREHKAALEAAAERRERQARIFEGRGTSYAPNTASARTTQAVEGAAGLAPVRGVLTPGKV